MTDTEAEITADVVKFIARCIDTVPHLEGLLLMWESAPQTWTEDEIAARIYVVPAVARRVVHDLTQHELVIRQEASPSRYTFNLQSNAATLLPVLAQAYSNHLVPVTRLIHSKR